MSGSTWYDELKAVSVVRNADHAARAKAATLRAAPIPLMSRRSSAFNARLVFAGVALASGGIAFYVPLLLSAVGLAHSGAWAAGILFGTNLGRVAGSHVASRHGVFTQRRGAIVANILLEGAALFAMAFIEAPWGLVAVATLAGLGSGLSFPGMKSWLMRLPGLDSARIFAGLSLALRLGMAVGYLAGALVGAHHLTAVFGVLLAMFVGYAGFMELALRDIESAPAMPAPAPAATSPSPDADAPLPIAITPLLLANAAFWFLTIQPGVTMSLYVPRYVAGLAVSAPYWMSTVTMLLLQMRVTRLARGTAGHLAFLRVGIACLVAGFALLALAGGHAASVLSAAVLVALAQVFYAPSLDVLISGDARARGLDLGKTMARQLFWQNLGMMSGSLFAGVLFDAALRRAMPSLAWSVPALCSLALLVAWTMGMRRAKA
jgi:MFS family permease